MDFIVKLFSSYRYNSILTLTGHNCTKVVILLSWQEDMDLLAIAKLYLHQSFPICRVSKIMHILQKKYTKTSFKRPLMIIIRHIINVSDYLNAYKVI